MVVKKTKTTLLPEATRSEPDLIGVSPMVSRANDQLLLLDRIVAQALVLVPSAEGASLELMDSDDLVYAACSGTLSPHVGIRLKIQESFSGLSVRTGQVLRCDDSERDPRVDRQACRLVGAVSMLCVPLIGQDQNLGVLKITSRLTNAFDEDDVSVLRTLGPFLTTAVATASQLSLLIAQLSDTQSASDSETQEQPTNQSRLRSSRTQAMTRFAANIMRPGLIDGNEARQAVLRALAPDAITMYVQPIYRLHDGRLWGVEALARFQITPLRPPDLWFQEAHRVGLGVELELAAVRKALTLVNETPTGIHVAINVGPAVLSTPYLKELLDGVNPTTVILELTEHAQIDDYHLLNQELTRYRRRGIKLAIDDAGTGVSGLAHILQLAPDYIKLDRELTKGIEIDPVRRSLATALVHFAEESGAEVIAEGIENRDALATLAGIDVGYGQGYYLARPSPIQEMDPTAVRPAIAMP